MTEKDIIEELQYRFGDSILSHPFPKAYCKNQNSIEAILLGCDPTNVYSNNLPYVFAIESELTKFNSFISGWKRKLKSMGLCFEKVYIQNLCRNYFELETSKNKNWDTVAEYWIPFLKEELNVFPKSIPVLLTSEKLYFVLLNDNVRKKKPIEIYSSKVDEIISENNNKLERPLIVFYRHWKYDIDKWPNHKGKIISIFSKV